MGDGDRDRWTRVARSAELEGPGPHALSAEGRDLVVLRTANGLRIYEGRCPHQGALLGEGELDGETLVCRNHRWRFSVETGERAGGPECLRACPAREVAGEVLADITGLVAEGTAKAKRQPTDLPHPPSLPFVGSAHLFDPSQMHLQLERWAKELGTPFTYKFGPLQVVVFGDLPSIQQILRERPETFRRASNIEPIFRELGVRGVFAAEGSSWRPQRRLSMEALSHRHLRGFYPTLASMAERLRKRWNHAAEVGEILDLAEELKRFTVDVTTQLAFGRDLGTLGDSDDVIQRKLELLFPAFNRRLFSVIPYWRILRLPEDRRVDAVVSELRQWLAGLVRETRAKLSPARSPTNFLEAMLSARDENDEPFDDDTIYGNAMTMLLAGEDTTAYTLAWSVHHLLESPSATARIREESDRVLGKARVAPDIEVANSLPFAGAVANEAMRLRPVAPIGFFEAIHDTVVGDVALPKGTNVAALMRLPAKNERYFPSAGEFRPERFLENSPGHSANLPFGSGPRICPGRTLALLEMRIVLSTLYRSFEVARIGPSSAVTEELSFTMMPSGLRVRLRRRA